VPDDVAKLRERIAELEAELAFSDGIIATLRRSEARNRAAIEQASDAIAICDVSGRMLDANAACTEMLGYARDEILALGLLPLMHPDDLAARPLDVGAIMSGAVVRGVRRFVRKNGSTFIGETSTKLLDDGRVQFVVRDIGQQVQAERDLKREAAYVQLLQQVAMAANEAVNVSDALMRCLAAVCEATGWELGHVFEPDGHESEQLVSARLWHERNPGAHAEFRERTEALLVKPGEGLSGRALMSGTPQWIPDLQSDADCPRRDVAARCGLRAAFASPVVYGGAVAVVLEFFATKPLPADARLVDLMTHVSVQLGHVIERQRSRAAVRVAHEEKDLLIRSLPCLLLCVDDAGIVTHCNDRAGVELQIAPDRAIGRPLAELAPPKGLERLPDLVARCARDDASLRIDELRYARATGDVALLELAARPIRHRETGRRSVLLVGTDITEIKRLETSVVTARRLEAIGQLAAGIAHEINTPMQYVGDNVRFLRDAFAQLCGGLDQLRAADADIELDFLLDEIPRALVQSEEGIAQVSQIVRAVKELSHPGRIQKAAIDVNKAIENAIAVSRHEWKHAADVALALAPGLPLVPCHLGQLSQALLNILVNAGHALSNRDRRGTIRISTHLDGEWVEIRIADDGPGIPEAIRTRVFDPFFTTKEVGHGTGQGLAIARSVIVDKHDGELRFETEEGRGTTFIARLPIVPREHGVVRSDPA
jgi:PAS domain S-box-containing protein